MENLQKIHGHIEVYRVKNDIRELVFSHHNTIDNTVYTAFRNNLLNTVVARVDTIVWGSYKNSAGSFIDSDYSGTNSTGTQGNLIMSAVGTHQAKFSGTFSFSSTKQINYWAIGNGYVAAASGITELVSNRYAHDSSLKTGASYVEYVNGEIAIVNWTISIGS